MSVEPTPDTINAVAAVIGTAEDDYPYFVMLASLSIPAAETAQQALDEINRLRLRTAEDQEALDVFNEYAAAIRFTDDQGMTDPMRTSRAVDALFKLAYARGRVAAAPAVTLREKAQ